MKQKLLISLIILLPTFVFGQRKHKYKYREYLTGQRSSFSSQTSDTILQSNGGVLTFHLLDNKGEAISFTRITVKNSEIDTTIQSNLDGFASIVLPSGSFSIEILNPFFTPISLDNILVKENGNTRITTNLGKSNALRIALIYSVRKLTDEEIKQIIDDLSNDKEEEENELIKNKTCYVMWEI